MNSQEAVEAIKNSLSVYLFAEVGDDGCISGGNNPKWIDIFTKEGIPGGYSVEESFLLKPLEHNSELWSGVAERYGFDCDFPAKPLDQLVTDICDLYSGAYTDSMSPSHVMTLLLRLTEQGFFVRHEQATILGSLRMNFTANNFWLIRIGDFYLAYDVARISGFGSSPSIICSRSIDTVIEGLIAYYGSSSQR